MLIGSKKTEQRCLQQPAPRPLPVRECFRTSSTTEVDIDNAIDQSVPVLRAVRNVVIGSPFGMFARSTLADVRAPMRWNAWSLAESKFRLQCSERLANAFSCVTAPLVVLS